MAFDRIAAICDVAVTNRRGRAETGRAKLMGHDVLLAKPETFMNLSGLSVTALLRDLNLGIEDLIVLYDELAFPLGTIKLAASGSANGHNGVISITGALGTEQWTRVRIGIGKAAPKSGGTRYLLAPMRKPELAALDEGLELAVRAVEAILAKGISAAMNEFNRKPELPKDPAS